MCVCVCVRVCVRACMRACVCVPDATGGLFPETYSDAFSAGARTHVQSYCSPVVLTEEEKEVHRTVEVTVDEDFLLSDDIFWNHFESSRNGGGKVDDVRIDEEERVVHVVFEKPEGQYSFMIDSSLFVYVISYISCLSALVGLVWATGISGGFPVCY